MATGLTSASGLLALLEEYEPKLKVYALNQLDSIVDEFWPEISDNIQQMYAPPPPTQDLDRVPCQSRRGWGRGQGKTFIFRPACRVPCVCCVGAQ